MKNVSVIIPTTGRSELRRAIASVMSQEGDVSVEIILVVDAHRESETARHAKDVYSLCDRVVFSGGIGGGGARNLGMRVAKGEFIAFLDDDDEWDATKLRQQIEFMDETQIDVASCRVRQRDQDERTIVSASPARLLHNGENVARYLFRNRRPGALRASLFTSTLVARAKNLPSWDSQLKRHQDWDWLIRCDQAGLRIAQMPATLVTIFTGSRGSISAWSGWEDSLQWAERTLGNERDRCDFLAAQTLRYALNARTLKGVLAVTRAIGRTHKVPNIGPLACGLVGVIPRRQIEQLLRWVH